MIGIHKFIFLEKLMERLLNTTEAAALCGITARQFRAWRLRWPGVCDPVEENGRTELYRTGDIEKLIEKRRAHG